MLLLLFLIWAKLVYLITIQKKDNILILETNTSMIFIRIDFFLNACVYHLKPIMMKKPRLPQFHNKTNYIRISNRL